MIDFGPFKLGQAVLRGEDGFEHFATLEGKPVSVCKYPGSAADLPDSLARTIDLQRPLGHSSWVRLRPKLPRLKRVRSCSEGSEEARRALLGYG